MTEIKHIGKEVYRQMRTKKKKQSCDPGLRYLNLSQAYLFCGIKKLSYGVIELFCNVIQLPFVSLARLCSQILRLLSLRQMDSLLILYFIGVIQFYSFYIFSWKDCIGKFPQLFLFEGQFEAQHPIAPVKKKVSF